MAPVVRVIAPLVPAVPPPAVVTVKSPLLVAEPEPVVRRRSLRVQVNKTDDSTKQTSQNTKPISNIRNQLNQ